MRLTEQQQSFIQDVFTVLDEHGVPSVVLRGHAEFPDRFHGSDVDVLVDPDAFSDAVTVCEDVLGLDSFESLRSGVLELVSDGVEQPAEAISMLVSSPDEFVGHVKTRLFKKPPNEYALRERSFDGERKLHLQNHLAYTSPLSGEKIRVDPGVERSMLDNRVEYAGVPVPSTPDELAHLVCRGVYDYDGDFPQYYRERCDQLVAELRSRPAGLERFESLLGLLFFSADELVAEAVLDSEYDQIRGRLARFSDY